MKGSFGDRTVLIEGLRKGDEAAYVYLVEHYHQRLCVYASSLIRNDLIAEDIVQNVFVQIWEKRKNLNPDFSIENYLYKSVHNKFIDQYRKGKALMALELKYITALESVIEENDESHLQDMMGILSHHIQELPPKCKQIFILSKKEGLTNIEISEYLNISKKTVEGQISKAFGILREKMGAKYEAILIIVFGAGTKNWIY